jgi:transglutaminase-like putative cysteine protease
MATTVNRSIPIYRNNFYFQDGALLVGILTGLLYLIVAISLDAAGHVPSMALLIPVTLGATALGLLMSFSRFDGFFALSHSMFTGLAWILFLMTTLVSEREIESFLDFGIPPLQAKVYFVLWKLLNWVDAAISSSASNDNYVFIFEVSFLLWWLTYLGVWAIFRYGYTWRAIIPAGVVLLINTYYAPQPVVGFLGVFCLLALLFLIRTNLAEQQLRWREQQIYFNQDIALDFLRNGFFYSILVLTLAWLAPSLGRNPLVRELMSPINELYEEVNQEVSQLYQGTAKQQRATAPTFGKSLSLGGERTVENMPVFTVSTPAGRYWRAVAFDTFDGRQWSNTLESEVSFTASETVPVPSWELRTPITQTITLLAPMGGVIVGAPDIRQVSVDVDATGQPSPAAAITAVTTDYSQAPPTGFEVTMAIAQQEMDTGDSYSVVSHYAQVTRQALEAAGTNYPQAILDRYLQLPDNFSPLVAQTALSVTAGLETPYAQAKALETFLRTYPYDDAIPAPPADKDPVEYFLFELRRGYCDYYATSMVLMLRYLGIPARTASGYAEGFWDEENLNFYVTDADAHTWVEVFFPNFGWIEFEPTAGESPLTRPEAAPETSNNQTDATTPLTSDPITSTDPMLDPWQEEMMSQAGGVSEMPVNSGPSWWIWAVGALVVVAIGVLGFRRTKNLGPTAFTPELSPILFERLQRWAERLGLRVRSSETPYEQARAWGQALPEGQPYISAITENYVRYRFSQEGFLQPMEMTNTLSAENSRLVAAWEALQPLLWRAWGRKVTNTNSHRNPFQRKQE